VTDLRGNGGSLGVDGVRQTRQAGHGFGAHPHLVAVGAALGGLRAVSHRRHPDATRGDSAMELDEVIGDQGLGSAALERRRLDDAIAQR
jgi:hypothetical protein